MTDSPQPARKPNPARAGVLFYAKDPARLSAFYERILGATVLHADADHRVLKSADTQLIIHAIPEQYSRDIVIASPPKALRTMRPNIAGTTSALMTSMTSPSRM